MLSTPLTTLFSSVALIGYVFTLVLAFSEHRQWQKDTQGHFFTFSSKVYKIIYACLIVHFALIINILFSDIGINLSLIPLLITVGWFMLFWVIIISKELANPLLIFLLFLLNILFIGLEGTSWTEKPVIVSNLAIGGHALISIIAYTLNGILALQASLLLAHDWSLKRQKNWWLIGLVQPLEYSEQLMYRLLWICFAWLSIALLSGIIVLDNWLAQQIAHKTVFTIIAWLISLFLLLTKSKIHTINTAKLILFSFISLMLGVVGSKFVIEFLL